MSTSTNIDGSGPSSLMIPTPPDEVSLADLAVKTIDNQVSGKEALGSRASEGASANQPEALADASVEADARDMPDSNSRSGTGATSTTSTEEDATIPKGHTSPVLECNTENVNAFEGGSQSLENNLSDSKSQTKVSDVKVPLIPEVRKVNFEHFKNRYSDKDGNYVIDVLISGAKFHDEVQHLHKIRKRQSSKKFKEYAPQPSPIRAIENKWIHRVRVQSPGLLWHLGRAVGEDWPVHIPRTFFRPFRVFIYFQPRIKEILGKLEARYKDTDEVKSPKEITSLPQELSNGQNTDVDTSEQFTNTTLNNDSCESTSETLVKIVKRNTEKILMNPKDRADSLQTDEVDVDDDDVSEAGTEESKYVHSMETLKAMRCYVDFVDAEILPLYNLFDGTSRTKVRFQDLWLLFKYGELVYGNQTPSSRYDFSHEGNRDQGVAQSGTVWRLYNLLYPLDFHRYPGFTKQGKPHYVSSDSEGDDNAKSAGESSKSATKDFRIGVYYVDYDGTSFGPVTHTFTIKPFEGERDIRALPCYPIRYSTEPDILIKRRNRGHKFEEYIGNTHNSYHGWTAALTPKGKPICNDEDGKDVRNPEFIESHVIVDFEEAYRAYPFWKPHFAALQPYSTDAWWTAWDDKLEILDWKTGARLSEKLQVDDGVFVWQNWENLENDETLTISREHYNKGSSAERMELRQEDYVLLPNRMFAYIFRDRKFAVLDIQFLRPISPQQNAFDHLKIIKDYKNIVKSLVASHFTKKDLERKISSLATMEHRHLGHQTSALDGINPDKESSITQDQESGQFNFSADRLSQDVIEGKGRSLVILLHGVPGVGKTATAEAVALENRKPLFVITCGDLGLTPSDVERHLKEVFRLAHLWDCVLLLDEADVFLSSRSNLDLNRNALVSVFLRVLEYYNGILFLTTNRVGHMDEAFKSRIHISLYYPPLTGVQAQEIFKVNIARLRETAKIRSQVANEPELQIDTDSILRFAHSLFDKKAVSATPWNGRQIRNAFQIASSLAYNEMHNEYTERLKKKKRGELQHADYPIPVLDENSFEIVSGVTNDFDDYMKETRGRDDASRALHYGERADRMKAKHNLGLSRLSSNDGTETFADSSRFDGEERTRTPARDAQSHGLNSQRYEQVEPLERGSYTNTGLSYDTRRRQVTPEIHRVRQYQNSERYDEHVEYAPGPSGVDQTRRYADPFPHDTTRNSRAGRYTSRPGMEYQDQPPMPYHATPPPTIRTPQSEMQYEGYDRNSISPSLRPTRRTFNENDADAYD